jgi:hypothetical protein
MFVLRERSLVRAVPDYLPSADPWAPHHDSVSLTRSEQVDRVDPRRLVVLLIALNEDMQAPNILESDETELDLIPSDILPAQLEFLGGGETLRVPKVHGELIGKQPNLLGCLGRADAAEYRDGLELDGLVEWDGD